MDSSSRGWPHYVTVCVLRAEDINGPEMVLLYCLLKGNREQQSKQCPQRIIMGGLYEGINRNMPRNTRQSMKADSRYLKMANELLPNAPGRNYAEVNLQCSYTMPQPLVKFVTTHVRPTTETGSLQIQSGLQGKQLPVKIIWDTLLKREGGPKPPWIGELLDTIHDLLTRYKLHMIMVRSYLVSAVDTTFLHGVLLLWPQL